MFGTATSGAMVDWSLIEAASTDAEAPGASFDVVDISLDEFIPVAHFDEMLRLDFDRPFDCMNIELPERMFF
jgi:hypothetical protein